MPSGSSSGVSDPVQDDPSAVPGFGSIAGSKSGEYRRDEMKTLKLTIITIRYRSPAENQSVRELARGKLVGARVDFYEGCRHGL